jgi:hypothetical protein
MRVHSSGRVTSFVTERDGVRWRKILHLTGCKILHLTGNDVSEAVSTTLALDISMSKWNNQPFLKYTANMFHLQWIRTGSRTYPASMDTGSSFLKDKKVRL